MYSTPRYASVIFLSPSQLGSLPRKSACNSLMPPSCCMAASRNARTAASSSVRRGSSLRIRFLSAMCHFKRRCINPMNAPIEIWSIIAQVPMSYSATLVVAEVGTSDVNIPFVTVYHFVPSDQKKVFIPIFAPDAPLCGKLNALALASA